MNISDGATIIIAMTAILGTYIAFDSWRRNNHLVHQDEKMEQIHLLVNSRLTEALDRIASLEEALHLATGVPKAMIQNPAETPPLHPLSP